jgi:hypothetical protein
VVTLEAIGTAHFDALPPIYGASGNYIYPGRDVAAAGTVDPYGDPCVMNRIPMDARANLTPFGFCGATPKIDTVLSVKIA